MTERDRQKEIDRERSSHTVRERERERERERRIVNQTHSCADLLCSGVSRIRLSSARF